MPLDHFEYMQVHINLIPQEIIDQYDLWSKVNKQGYVMCEIQKGMYGLPQAGIIANKLLAKCLGNHGYMQTKHTPGLWKHIT